MIIIVIGNFFLLFRCSKRIDFYPNSCDKNKIFSEQGLIQDLFQPLFPKGSLDRFFLCGFCAAAEVVDL